MFGLGLVTVLTIPLKKVCEGWLRWPGSGVETGGTRGFRGDSGGRGLERPSLRFRNSAQIDKRP